MTPNHLELKSADGTKLNLEALYQIAPSYFTEVKDEKTGELRHVVNFTTLRQLLGDDAVEDANEMYQFTWPGKQEARREAARPISDTLRPCPEESVDWDTTQNLYIEGDNLAVLKLLQKGYMGKVKMIYIDPPYNTGNDFIYHDDFAVSQKEMDLFSGDVDEDGNRYRKNTDSNGRFHSDWCSMIYSRLMVARTLLSDDGIILISIGEHEIDNLKKICFEVFGHDNNIETYIWESTFRPDNSSKVMRRNAEYIACFAKEKSQINALIGEVKKKEGLPSLTKSSMNASILTFPEKTVVTYLPNGHYYAGVRDSYELLDDVDVKDGIIQNKFRLKGHMIWGQENLERELQNGTRIIIKGEGFVPYTEKPGDSVMSPAKLIPNTIVGDILSSNAEMARLFTNKVFSYPKPISLLKYLLHYFEDKSFISLDFFSGSGTIADAVMQLNSEDGGTRRFIAVQLPENLDDNYNKASDKEKVILKNAIELCDSIQAPHVLTEVAKERIRRAGKKIKEESPLTTQNLDTGFRVFKLSDSNFNEVEFTPKEFTQDLLSGLESNIKEGRTDLDLLFGAMLDWGVQLSLPMSKETVDGCDIYTVNEGDLVACFSENVTENVVAAMASKMPLRVLFRDSCFDEDKAKINVFELFKQKLDWGEDEAIKNIRVI